jgi:hypothetical protein
MSTKKQAPQSEAFSEETELLILGTCTECKKEIAYETGFECKAYPGRHKLAPKEYYHLGARHIGGQSPNAFRDRRFFGPHLVLRPGGRSYDVRMQTTVEEPNIEVKFVSGKYTTSDSLEQYYLDRHVEVLSGQKGLDEWRKVYLSPDQQRDVMSSELKSMERQVSEQRSLIDRAQAQTQTA